MYRGWVSLVFRFVEDSSHAFIASVEKTKPAAWPLGFVQSVEFKEFETFDAYEYACKMLADEIGIPMHVLVS